MTPEHTLAAAISRYRAECSLCENDAERGRYATRYVHEIIELAEQLARELAALRERLTKLEWEWRNYTATTEYGAAICKGLRQAADALKAALEGK